MVHSTVYYPVKTFSGWHMSTLVLIVLGLVVLCVIMYKLGSLNKNPLSERKLDNYLLFKELYDGFGKSMHFLMDDVRESSMAAYQYTFGHFLNTPYWYGHSSVFDGDEITRYMFIDSLQRLHGRAEEARLLFNDKRIADYYDAYADLLMTMHEYSLMANNESNEPVYKEKVFAAFDKLIDVYDDLKDVPIAKYELKI